MYKFINRSRLPGLSNKLYSSFVTRLASGDVETQAGRVPVLEELQAQAIGGAKLDALGSTSSARSSGDDIVVTRLETDRVEGAVLRRGVVVGGLLVGDAAALGEDQVTGAGKGVRGGLEIFLLREKEDHAAGLALVRFGDIEVENR